MDDPTPNNTSGSDIDLFERFASLQSGNSSTRLGVKEFCPAAVSADAASKRDGVITNNNSADNMNDEHHSSPSASTSYSEEGDFLSWDQARESSAFREHNSSSTSRSSSRQQQRGQSKRQYGQPHSARPTASDMILKRQFSHGSQSQSSSLGLGKPSPSPSSSQINGGAGGRVSPSISQFSGTSNSFPSHPAPQQQQQQQQQPPPQQQRNQQYTRTSGSFHDNEQPKPSPITPFRPMPPREYSLGNELRRSDNAMQSSSMLPTLPSGIAARRSSSGGSFRDRGSVMSGKSSSVMRGGSHGSGDYKVNTFKDEKEERPAIYSTEPMRRISESKLSEEEMSMSSGFSASLMKQQMNDDSQQQVVKQASPLQQPHQNTKQESPPHEQQQLPQHDILGLSLRTDPDISPFESINNSENPSSILEYDNPNNPFSDGSATGKMGTPVETKLSPHRSRKKEDEDRYDEGSDTVIAMEGLKRPPEELMHSTPSRLKINTAAPPVPQTVGNVLAMTPQSVSTLSPMEGRSMLYSQQQHNQKFGGHTAAQSAELAATARFGRLLQECRELTETCGDSTVASSDVGTSHLDSSTLRDSSTNLNSSTSGDVGGRYSNRRFQSEETESVNNSALIRQKNTPTKAPATERMESLLETRRRKLAEEATTSPSSKEIATLDREFNASFMTTEPFVAPFYASSEVKVVSTTTARINFDATSGQYCDKSLVSDLSLDMHGDADTSNDEDALNRIMKELEGEVAAAQANGANSTEAVGFSTKSPLFSELSVGDTRDEEVAALELKAAVENDMTNLLRRMQSETTRDSIISDKEDYKGPSYKSLMPQKDDESRHSWLSYTTDDDDSPRNARPKVGQAFVLPMKGDDVAKRQPQKVRAEDNLSRASTDYDDADSGGLLVGFGKRKEASISSSSSDSSSSGEFSDSDSSSGFTSDSDDSSSSSGSRSGSSSEESESDSSPCMPSAMARGLDIHGNHRDDVSELSFGGASALVASAAARKSVLSPNTREGCSDDNSERSSTLTKPPDKSAKSKESGKTSKSSGSDLAMAVKSIPASRRFSVETRGSVDAMPMLYEESSDVASRGYSQASPENQQSESSNEPKNAPAQSSMHNLSDLFFGQSHATIFGGSETGSSNVFPTSEMFAEGVHDSPRSAPPFKASQKERSRSSDSAESKPASLQSKGSSHAKSGTSAGSYYSAVLARADILLKARSDSSPRASTTSRSPKSASSSTDSESKSKQVPGAETTESSPTMHPTLNKKLEEVKEESMRSAEILDDEAMWQSIENLKADHDDVGNADPGDVSLVSSMSSVVSKARNSLLGSSRRSMFSDQSPGVNDAISPSDESDRGEPRFANEESSMASIPKSKMESSFDGEELYEGFPSRESDRNGEAFARTSSSHAIPDKLETDARKPWRTESRKAAADVEEKSSVGSHLEHYPLEQTGVVGDTKPSPRIYDDNDDEDKSSSSSLSDSQGALERMGLVKMPIKQINEDEAVDKLAMHVERESTPTPVTGKHISGLSNGSSSITEWDYSGQKIEASADQIEDKARGTNSSKASITSSHKASTELSSGSETPVEDNKKKPSATSLKMMANAAEEMAALLERSLLSRSMVHPHVNDFESGSFEDLSSPSEEKFCDDEGKESEIGVSSDDEQPDVSNEGVSLCDKLSDTQSIGDKSSDNNLMKLFRRGSSRVSQRQSQMSSPSSDENDDDVVQDVYAVYTGGVSSKPKTALLRGFSTGDSDDEQSAGSRCIEILIEPTNLPSSQASDGGSSKRDNVGIINKPWYLSRGEFWKSRYFYPCVLAFALVIIVVSCAVGVTSSQKEAVVVPTPIVSSSQPSMQPSQSSIAPNLRPTMRPSEPPPSWIQVGGDLVGESPGDDAGFSVSVSKSGNRVVVGSRRNAKEGLKNRGSARIFQFDSTTGSYVPIMDILGEEAGDQCGFSVSTSKNGNRVAIGSLGSDKNGNNSGQVRIFEENALTNRWRMVTEILGEGEGSLFGSSVSLSQDGFNLAVGAPYHTEGTDLFRSGRAYVYREVQESSWAQIGDPIYGEASSDLLGWSVSFSPDARILAIGAPGLEGSDSSFGYVKTYTFESNNWQMYGAVLSNGIPGDRFGFSVYFGLNQEDNLYRIAIGAPGTTGENGYGSGYACMYENDGSGWTHLDGDLVGDKWGENLGYSVSLSSEANRMIAGVPNKLLNGVTVGQIQVRDVINGVLVPAGDLYGKDGEKFGVSTAISYDGRLLFGGATDANLVRVYGDL
eukprot:g10775.t1 g10775   contig4:2530771-2537514(-)